MYQCYGRKFGKLSECPTCECRAFCATAADLPVSFDAEDIANHAEAVSSEPDFDCFKPDLPEQVYSHADMVALVRKLLNIEDARIRDLVRRKIENPDITLSEIGKAWGGVKKQDVRKDIVIAIRYFPELAAVLCNRPNHNRWREKKQSPVVANSKPLKTTPSQAEGILRQRKLKRGPGSGDDSDLFAWDGSPEKRRKNNRSKKN